MRQGKTELLTISLPKDTFEDIESVRWEKKMTRSRFVLEAINTYLKALKKTETAD